MAHRKPTGPDLQTRRIQSLDGLRGIAALVVVVYHALLVTPTLWDQIAGRPVRNNVQWILNYTPARIVWAGGEAVWIFFVLSGFVLVRPYLAGRSVHAGRYYLRRTIRLYVPFLGSFLLAVVLRALQPDPSGSFSGWLFVHRLPNATSDAVKTLFLFAGDATNYNDVWWSLRWEVWFSALLPLVVIAARRYRRHALGLTVACLVLVGLSNFAVTATGLVHFGHDNPVLYLPMFGIGVALAMGEEGVRAALENRSVTTIVVGAVLCSAAMTSTVVGLVVLDRVGLSIDAAWAIAGPIGVAGAGGLVALALCGAGFRDVLATRPMTWLGERSYTLYLIHEPILITVVLVLGLSTLTWWWIPVAVGISILATVVLYPLIERPALHLIRRIPPAPRPTPKP